MKVTKNYRKHKRNLVISIYSSEHFMCHRLKNAEVLPSWAMRNDKKEEEAARC